MENSAIVPNTQPIGGSPLSLKGLPPRILLADDDDCIRRLHATVLKRVGYYTETASDGASAWEALQASSYDLLITDYNMPKLSGADLIKKARSARMTLHILVVSGSLPAFEREWDASLEGMTTMAKPFSIQQLLATVNRVMGLHAAGPMPE